VTLPETPAQTIGPFFAYGLAPGQYGYPWTSVAGGALADDDAEGERIRIVGRVLDGAGAPVDDALVEIWQADARGRYRGRADARGANAAFRGFGRCGTGADAERRFVFHTVKPGSVGGQAPHVNVVVFMRGLLSHVATRIYFADEQRANAADPVLARVPAERRATLMARREETPGGTVYRFDIRMQGTDETVFFDV
jgi:protocatechuate 3,4-dioxygenase alpha subunit